MEQVKVQVEALRSVTGNTQRGPEANLLDVVDDGYGMNKDSQQKGGNGNSSSRENDGNSMSNTAKRPRGTQKPFGLKRK
jgi:hypothetical protein